MTNTTNNNNNPTTAQQGRPQTVYSLRNFTVLLVEDYEFMQSLIGGMLKAFGVGNILVCSNAKEATELLTVIQAQIKIGSAKPIDMILTDWMMPGGSGLELINWMRNHKNDFYRFMPIMLISAFASEDIVVASRDNGANEALVKPLSAEKLASRILAMIDNPRAYVKTKTFFGPDRRRQIKKINFVDRRVMKAEQLVQHTERI